MCSQTPEPSAPHHIGIFMEGFLCNHDWLDHWPLMSDSISSPSPLQGTLGRAERSNPRVTWLVFLATSPTILQPSWTPPCKPSQEPTRGNKFQRCLELSARKGTKTKPLPFYYTTVSSTGQDFLLASWEFSPSSPASSCLVVSAQSWFSSHCCY